MTVSTAAHLLKQSLQSIYDQREASAIATITMESITGKTRSEQIIDPNKLLTTDQQHLFDRYVSDLLRKRPLQYVLGEAWFFGMKLFVDENVLIPRPETEELVKWSLDTLSQKSLPHPHVLDIGTGSGCIAICIKKNFPTAKVQAMDISSPALAIAQKNAKANHVSVDFINGDIADPATISAPAKYDLIVSNPPYIPLADKSSMDDHVVEFEPHLALFVADNDPLKFYHLISEFFIRNAVPGSFLFFETHWQYAQNVQELLEKKGLKDVEVRKDLQGQDRMVRSKYP